MQSQVQTAPTGRCSCLVPIRSKHTPFTTSLRPNRSLAHAISGSTGMGSIHSKRKLSSQTQNTQIARAAASQSVSASTAFVVGDMQNPSWQCCWHADLNLLCGVQDPGLETDPRGIPRVPYKEQGWNFWRWRDHKIHYIQAGKYYQSLLSQQGCKCAVRQSWQHMECQQM